MLQHACVFAMNSKQLMQCKPINFETNHYVDTLDMCVHMAKLQCEQKKEIANLFRLHVCSSVQRALFIQSFR